MRIRLPRPGPEQLLSAAASLVLLYLLAKSQCAAWWLLELPQGDWREITALQTLCFACASGAALELVLVFGVFREETHWYEIMYSSLLTEMWLVSLRFFIDHQQAGRTAAAVLAAMCAAIWLLCRLYGLGWRGAALRRLPRGKRRIRRRQVRRHAARMIRTALICCMAALFITNSIVENHDVRAAVLPDESTAAADADCAGMRALRSSVWFGSTVPQRLAALQALENYVACAQGRSPCTVVGKKLQDNVAGSYDDDARCVEVSLTLLRRNDENRACADTVLHEGEHALQHDVDRYYTAHCSEPFVQENVFFQNARAFHQGIAAYSSADDFWDYYENPLEEDANRFAENNLQAILDYAEQGGDPPQLVQ